MRYQAHMWKKPGLLIKAPGTLKNPAELELAAKPAAVPSAAWGRGARGRQEEDQEGKVKKAQETLQQHFLFQLTGSTDSRRDKRRSKVKRKASQSGHRLEQKDVEELQQFCRQAEIQKLREEVLASMPSMPGKSAKQAQPASEPVDTVAEVLSPKTKKVVLAQSRILTQDSVSKRLLEVTSWVDVTAQLSTQSAPDIKSLCAQICEHVPRNKSDCIVKIMDQLQSSDWTGSPRGQSLSPTVSLLHPDRWLQLCFLSFFTGFVLGFSMAESGLSTPRWLPAPFARSVRYVQALKVSQSLSVGRVCSVTLASDYHWHTSGNSQCRHLTAWVQVDLRRERSSERSQEVGPWCGADTNPTSQKACYFFTWWRHQACPFLIGRVFMPPMNFQLMKLLSFFDAADCGFVSWRHAAFHIEPRVKTRFWGSAHQQALKINTRPGS